MSMIKAKKIDDETVTESVLARAITKGKERRNSGLRAKGVRYLPEFKALAISFADQAAILLPVKKYSEFADLSIGELNRIEIALNGSALYLEERDLHVSIAGLVSASKPLMQLASSMVATLNGRRTSAAKAQAARQNGHKGGRPKKVG
ncbi:DUF2442 domain-containing protein [Duganella sp. FT80W]|uniref:DUF2442 domain-containing protein n=1 Tax=Duganella guangzhouensis TaxID=2666084 RepID=A0A6I2KX95_9BURK|nr:DUF2442 domain-containing protein [Duganella guangzhouensis]MRW88609.1 DUF2442 domain-containing protein [Duganella guangzhouensis]